MQLLKHIFSDAQNSSTPSLAEPSTTKASVTTPGTIPLTNLHRSTCGTPTEGKIFLRRM